MAQRTTTIPITGTREYVRAFKAYAFQRGRNMSDLVREAVEAHYGEDIKKAEASFFPSSGNECIQKDTFSIDDASLGPGAA